MKEIDWLQVSMDNNTDMGLMYLKQAIECFKMIRADGFKEEDILQLVEYFSKKMLRLPLSNGGGE